MEPIDLRSTVRRLVEPTVQRMGYDLVAVEWLGGQRGRVLRLSIDAPGGVTAGDCAETSARLSLVLDEADPIEGPYDLEVSSPGIERPVQRHQDFARFRGYRARIRLVPGLPRRRFSGRLDGIDGDEVLIVVDGQEHRLHLEDIERARLVLDLDEYQALAEGLPAIPPLESSHDDQ